MHGLSLGMTPVRFAVTLVLISVMVLTPTSARPVVAGIAPSDVDAAMTIRPPSASGPSTLASSGAITVGPARLTATFKSVGIELPFTGDSNGNASVAVHYRPVGAAPWREGLPLWRAVDSSGAGFYGSIVLLEAGSTYDVRLVVADPDGVAGTRSQAMKVTTRAETIRPAKTLQPTHFVRLNGSDSNPGTANSASGAWATIRKALMSAPAGAVVQVGSGSADEFFPDSGLATGGPVQRTTPITFIAPYPALGDDRQPMNAGRRTFIEGSVRAGPRGTTPLPIVAPWTRVTLTGPMTGSRFAVWKWANAVPADRTVTTLAYGAARASIFKRLWVWSPDAARLSTPAGWAELMHGNQTLNYGFYQAGTDLYARLPDDADPNGFWWSGGVGPGIALNGADSRVSGLVFRALTFGIRSGPDSDRLVIDHNDFQTVTSPIRGSAETPDQYATDMVIQYNLVRNTGLWSDDQARNPSAPWQFVKQRIKLANGAPYPTNRIGGAMEGAGVSPVGSRRTVVRFNTIEGTFDGVGTVDVGSPTAEDRFTNGEWDIHDNLIRKIADDAYEPARGGINWRIRNNRNEYTSTFMSTGPTSYGPVYIFNNVSWQVGLDGLRLNADGTRDGIALGMQFKYSGSSTPQARVYVVNNTFWSNRARTAGSNNAVDGETDQPEAFHLRNNIFRGDSNAFDFVPSSNGKYDEDYNQFLSSDVSKGMRRVVPATTFTDFQAYRATSGQGIHSNLAIADVHNVALGDAQFTDASRGVLTLRRNSMFAGKGIAVPNIAPTGPIDLGYVP